MNSRSDLNQNVFESFPSVLLVFELNDTSDLSSCRQIRVNDAACQVTGMEMKANNEKLWREAYPKFVESELTDKILNAISTSDNKK